MFTATSEHEPSFHQFADGSTDRIRYKRVNERTGDEVDYGDIVKGIDVGGGAYVMVADEELDQVATLDHLPGEASFGKGELAMATQLITSMDEPWRPDRYRDTYTDQVNERIEATRRGNDVHQAAEPPEATGVIDLFDALRRTVDAARGTSHRTARRTARSTTAASRGRGAAKMAAPTRTVAKKAVLDPPGEHARRRDRRVGQPRRVRTAWSRSRPTAPRRPQPAGGDGTGQMAQGRWHRASSAPACPSQVPDPSWHP